MNTVTQSSKGNVMLPSVRPANGSHGGENAGDVAQVPSAIDLADECLASGYGPPAGGAASLDFATMQPIAMQLAKHPTRDSTRFQRGGRGVGASCAANTYNAFPSRKINCNALTPSRPVDHAERQPGVSTD
jgi:hypothetical protein